MKKGKVLVLGIIGVLLLMLVGCSDSLTGPVTPGTAGTVTLKPNGGTGAYTIQDPSGTTIPTTTQTNSDGTVTISGLDPKGEYYIIMNPTDANKAVLVGGTTYGEAPDAGTNALANILAGVSGNAHDAIELEKLLAILGFLGQSGTAFENAVVAVYKEFAPSANFYLNQYLDISGWNQQAAYASGKTAYAVAKSDWIKQVIAAGGSTATADRMKTFYSVFAQLSTDFIAQGGNAQMLGNIMLAVGMVDDLGLQKIANGLVSAGILSVRKYTLSDTVKLNREKIFVYGVLFGASGVLNGLIQIISNPTWKAVAQGLHTWLNNMLLAETILAQTKAEFESYKSTTRSTSSAAFAQSGYAYTAEEQAKRATYRKTIADYKLAREAGDDDAMAARMEANIDATKTLQTDISDTEKREAAVAADGIETVTETTP